MSLFKKLFGKNKDKENVPIITISDTEQLKLLDNLDDVGRIKYSEIMNYKHKIENNAEKLKKTDPEYYTIINESLSKIDSIIEEFLNYYINKMQYLKMYNNTDIKKIEDELSDIQNKMNDNLESEKINDVLHKRASILDKRKNKYYKIKENIKIIETQLLALEDLIMLIYEQSFSLKDPKNFASQINDLLIDFKTAEETIEELDLN